MKIKITKTELIYPNERIITHTPVTVDNVEEYRKILRETHECNRVLFVYEETE